MKYTFVIVLLIFFVMSGCTEDNKKEKPSKRIESYSFHQISEEESEVLTMEDIEFDEDDLISYDEEDFFYDTGRYVLRNSWQC